MAPKGRDNNPSGLGRAIINRKVKDARKAQEFGLYSSDVDSSIRLKSVTQERDLDEFFNTAQLAGTEFTAERRNVKIIPQTTSTSQNPYLLSDVEQQRITKKHEENKLRLQVPRRPPWTRDMTTADLDRQEKTSFLDWRRGLAELQDRENFIMTPFERNLEVWRQLWRVVERSHLIVQIVDARNPLRFRSEDLEKYVSDIEGPEGESGSGKGKRRSMLLINKADLLTGSQRKTWADYFDGQGIQYAFYSAAAAVLLQQESMGAELHDEGSSNQRSSLLGADDSGRSTPELEDHQSDDSDAYFSLGDDDDDSSDSRAKILSVGELENMFFRLAPAMTEFTNAVGNAPSNLVVGLVGYPNVGKSSTINSLLGQKKVSVSSTPGKRNTSRPFASLIPLFSAIVLVLYSLSLRATKAHLVCDGVLPIDQLREHSGPITLLTKRIPRVVLEATYGIHIKTVSREEGGDGSVTAENFLIAYAIARGFMRSGQGNPDEARAARYILKDYVNGKLLFCHPPPGNSEVEFNQPTYEASLRRVQGKKLAPNTRVGKSSDTYVPSSNATYEPSLPSIPHQQGQRAVAFDKAFFQTDVHPETSRPHPLTYTKYDPRQTLFPHQHLVSSDGTPIDPMEARLGALSNVHSSDKRHKKPKRAKQRSGKGYDI